MTKPAWQNWDDPGVAEWIESYWKGSLHEGAQRQALGNLCGRYVEPGATLVEIGCGTGLVYERLVPEIVDNDSYTGVDISEQMLKIARAKHPAGRFITGTGYGLQFADQTFDYAVSFEVVIHIPEIAPFISELFRVSKRAAIFTSWIAAQSDLDDGRVRLAGSGEFINRGYSHRYLMRAIEQALPGLAVNVELAILRADCWAYVLTRGSGKAGLTLTGVRPISGYTEALLAHIQGRK